MNDDRQIFQDLNNINEFSQQLSRKLYFNESLKKELEKKLVEEKEFILLNVFLSALQILLFSKQFSKQENNFQKVFLVSRIENKNYKNRYLLK